MYWFVLVGCLDFQSTLWQDGQRERPWQLWVPDSIHASILPCMQCGMVPVSPSGIRGRASVGPDRPFGPLCDDPFQSGRASSQPFLGGMGALARLSWIHHLSLAHHHGFIPSPSNLDPRGLHMVGSNGCLKEPSPATDLDGIMACQGWGL